MIRKLEAEDIIQLRNLDDHVEQFFPCSKSEWNQWLMANISNPDTLIIGDEKHYLVAVNTIQKPLRIISLLFSSILKAIIRSQVK